MSRMERRFETDSGAVVSVPSILKVSAPKGECIKAMARLKGKKRQKKATVKTKSQRRFVAEFAEKSHVVSPTEVVCERMREGYYLPYSMGATGGTK